MNRSNDLRKNAENCVALAEVDRQRSKEEALRTDGHRWNSLADTQAWLDGETEKKSASGVSQPDI